MTGTENIQQTLPIWVLLTFVILITGIIALIYSRGNWRQTITLVALALFTVLVASQSDDFLDYLNTHFIGSYNPLGVPIEEDIGLSLLFTAWPLWIVHVFLAVIITIAVCKFWLPTHHKSDDKNISTELPHAPSLQNVAKQITDASTKNEINVIRNNLKIALENVEKEAYQNQELEIKLLQIETEQKETIAELKEEVAAFSLEITAKEMQKQHLIDVNLQQIEEITRLTNALRELQKNLK